MRLCPGIPEPVMPRETDGREGVLRQLMQPWTIVSPVGLVLLTTTLRRGEVKRGQATPKMIGSRLPTGENTKRMPPTMGMNVKRWGGKKKK